MMIRLIFAFIASVKGLASNDADWASKIVLWLVNDHTWTVNLRFRLVTGVVWLVKHNF
ncbi:hypothetical protein [Salibacterium salarium]|uniref:hypothetical protein n=1 Tax=Salibacterium salarium TaxID=284579 RepID=UPI00163AACD2|nr:hypothetical protein [Salibacterium salarium]